MSLREVNGLESVMGKVQTVSIRGSETSLWYSPPRRQILLWGFWASACGSRFSQCLLLRPHRTLLRRGALQAEVGHPSWEHASGHKFVPQTSVRDVNNCVAWVNGARFIPRTQLSSPVCVSSVLRASVLSLPILCLLFPFTADTHLKKPAYTDTETVYLGGESVIYAAQLFALSLLCLLFLNLAHFLESCCLTAWHFFHKFTADDLPL